MRVWLALAGLAAFVPFVGDARADPPPEEQASRLTIEWSAPDGCPTADDLQAEIRRLLGDGGLAGRSIDVEARIADRGRGVLQLELVLESDHGRATRVIEATSCEALVQAGALVVALAVDPEAVAALVEGAPDAIDPEVFRVIDGENGEGLSTPGGQLVAPASPYRLPPPRPAEPRPVPEVRGLFFVGAALDAGTLPDPTFGVEVGGGTRIRRVELSAAFRWLSQRSQSIDPPTPLGGTFVLYTSRLRACAHASFGRHFELAPCAFGEAGGLVGEGFGVGAVRKGSAPWLALGAGLTMRLTSRWVAVDLLLDGAVPLVRTRYVVDGAGTVHRPSPVGFRGGILITTFFP